MKYEHLISVCESYSKHISDLTGGEGDNLVPYYELKIYGLPEDWDDERMYSVFNETDEAIYLGEVTGYMILGFEIFRQGKDMYTVCDDLSADLEFIVSALSEDDGPLSLESGGEVLNHFYIEKLELNDDSIMKELIDQLPEMLITHCHVFPSTLSYYPVPLPHEESKLDKVKRDLAMMAYTDTVNMIFDSENYDPEKPHLVMSEEQQNLMLGRRSKGASYPSEYINHEEWQPFLDSGFREWRETRVLFKDTEE